MRIVGFLVMLFAVSSCANTCIDPGLPLKPVRHICGIVANQINERIPQATLALLKDGAEVATVVTDADGYFDFGRVEGGNYELRAQSDGYLPGSRSIQIIKPIAQGKRELVVVLPLTSCGGGIAFRKR
jgi:hypothetical protein